LAFGSVPSIADIDNDPVSAIYALISLHAPIRSSFMVHERVNDTHGAFFKVLAKYKGQKSILFGRIEFEPKTHESSKDDFESL